MVAWLYGNQGKDIWLAVVRWSIFVDPFYIVCVHTHPTFLWVVLRINKICMVTAWWVAVWWMAV